MKCNLLRLAGLVRARYGCRMRLGLWWIALLPLACGKSTSRSAATDRGDGEAGAPAGVGGSASGGEAGRPDVTGGGPSSGGASSAAGSAGSAGDATGGTSGNGAVGNGGSGELGGASGTAGNAGAGDGGAAGAPVVGCQGQYDVCSCGCCGPVPVRTACYYPERGDDLAAIEAADRLMAMSSSCLTAGCSPGVRMLCCEAAEPEAGATYDLVGWSQDTAYIAVSRRGDGDRCTTLTIARWGTDSEIPLELPDRYVIDETYDGPCDDMMGAPVRGVIGALGVMSQAPQDRCVFDLDFTLFFLADDGTVDRVRFQANDLVMRGCS